MEAREKITKLLKKKVFVATPLELACQIEALFKECGYRLIEPGKLTVLSDEELLELYMTGWLPSGAEALSSVELRLRRCRTIAKAQLALNIKEIASQE